MRQKVKLGGEAYCYSAHLNPFTRFLPFFQFLFYMYYHTMVYNSQSTLATFPKLRFSWTLSFVLNPKKKRVIHEWMILDSLVGRVSPALSVVLKKNERCVDKQQSYPSHFFLSFLFYVYYVKPFGSCQISCSGCSLPTYMISSQIWCSLICSYYICAVSPHIFNDLRLFWVRPTRSTGKSLYYIAASIWGVRRNRSQHQSCRKVLQSILFVDCGRIFAGFD